MEIASAFATFANGGFRVEPTALLGFVGSSERQVERRNAKLERAVDPDALTVLDSILQGAVIRGTGASARRLGAQGIFAGKTGTTNEGRDAWFIGFSPRLLVAVWVGFDDNRGLGLSGSAAAVPIFAEFVRRLPSHYFEEPFPTSPGVVTVQIDPTSRNALDGGVSRSRCPRSSSPERSRRSAAPSRRRRGPSRSPGPAFRPPPFRELSPDARSGPLRPRPRRPEPRLVRPPALLLGCRSEDVCFCFLRGGEPRRVSKSRSGKASSGRSREVRRGRDFLLLCGGCNCSRR